jgi:hypothetical protein
MTCLISVLISGTDLELFLRQYHVGSGSIRTYSEQNISSIFRFKVRRVQIKIAVAIILTADRSINKQKNKQTPWSESASELYRPSDRRYSAK